MNFLEKLGNNLKRNDMDFSKEANCDLAGKCDLYESVCDTTYKCIQVDGDDVWSQDEKTWRTSSASDKCGNLPFELKSHCKMTDENRCFKNPDEDVVTCVFEAKEEAVLPQQIPGNKYMNVSSEEASNMIPCGYSSLDKGGYKVHLATSLEECRSNKIKDKNTKDIIDQSRTFWRIKNDQPERCFAKDCSADSEHWVQINIPAQADQIAQLRTRAWVLGKSFESDGNLYEFDPATETWDRDEDVVLEKIFTHDGTICGINNNGEMFCKRDNNKWVNIAALDTNGNKIRLFDVSGNDLNNETFAIDGQGRPLRLNDENTWEDLSGPNLTSAPQKIGKHIIGKEKSGNKLLKSAVSGEWISKENYDKCRMDVQVDVMKKKLNSQKHKTLNTGQTLKSAFQDLNLRLEDNNLCADSPDLCNTCLCELQGSCKSSKGSCSQRAGWLNTSRISMQYEAISQTFENKLETLIRRNPDTNITNDPILFHEIENEIESKCDV